MVIMYGIANCDTIKKAKKWLEEHNVQYQFHDYKKQGVPEEVLRSAITQFGIDTIVNKRGTTYRKLDDSVKSNINEENVIELLKEHSSMIKRPILKMNENLIIGFKSETYKAAL